MIFTVQRYGSGSQYPPGSDSTVGTMIVPKIPPVVTLEDEYRLQKVHGETRIPAGRYRLALRTEGNMHAAYLAKFGPEFHKGMIHLLDVKGFLFIYIHILNKASESLGCLGVGESIVKIDGGNYEIAESKKAYVRIYPPIRDAILAGETWLEVVDGSDPLPVTPREPPVSIASRDVPPPRPV